MIVNVRHRIDGLERLRNQDNQTHFVRHRIDGLESKKNS